MGWYWGEGKSKGVFDWKKKTREGFISFGAGCGDGLEGVVCLGLYNHKDQSYILLKIEGARYANFPKSFQR